MKNISLLFYCLLCPLHAVSDNANVDLSHLKTQLAQHKKDLPQGSLQDRRHVKKLIDILYVFDQSFRQSIMQNCHKDTAHGALLKECDAFHTSIMKDILQIYPWIVISKFGPEYDHKAWLLVQHADHDPGFQYDILLLLQQLVKCNETNKKNVAYLYDRVAIKNHALGMRQKYGTQVNITKDGIQL